jgi:hypothetical protein
MEEFLKAMFSIQSMPKLYSEDKQEKLVSHWSEVLSRELEVISKQS